jgi:ribosomal RNA-processing protein 12
LHSLQRYRESWTDLAQEVTKAYRKVVDLFKQSIKQSTTKQQTGHVAPHDHKDTGSLTIATQDILILLLPHLSSSDATALFQLCLSSEILNSKDNGVQKRGYKTLGNLVDTNKIAVDVEPVLRALDEFGDGLLPAAKKVSLPNLYHLSSDLNFNKDRFKLLLLLIPHIPSGAMHIIPRLIPEAVLGTKEPSEKARTAAFELIVAMGRKMSEGGIVKKTLVGDMDEDGAGESRFLSQKMSHTFSDGRYSCCKSRRVHDHGRRWSSWC